MTEQSHALCHSGHDCGLAHASPPAAGGKPLPRKGLKDEASQSGIRLGPSVHSIGLIAQVRVRA